MNKLFTFTLFLLISVYGFGQETGAPRIMVESIQGPTPWTSLDANNQAATFQFAIVTDRTGGHRPGIFPIGIQKLNLLQPEFVLSVGDMIEGYTRDQAEIDRQWEEFNGFIDELTVPFFYVPGNHDYTNEVLAEKWKALFGKSYYHFLYKDVLFLCLNSEDNMRGAGKGTIDDAQYEYVKKVLDENKEAKWTLLFMHQPLWNQQDTKRWKDVETLLAERKHTVFVGHNHTYVKYERNNGKYFVLATTGGGSKLRGPRIGEFDHVVWVTMTNEGPILANLLLDGIWDENIVTEQMAKFAHPLVDQPVLQIQPMTLSDSTFDHYQTELKISNTSDVNMKVELAFMANTNLVPDVTAKTITIAPNSVEELPLTLQALTPVSTDSLRPLILNSTITYQDEGQPDITYDNQYRLLPEFATGLRPVETPVKVDGNLDDWGQLSYVVNSKSYVVSDPFSHDGDKDVSFRFDISYDDQNLYLAAQVTDDELMVVADKRAYQQDGISFTLDARPVQESVMGKGGGLFKEILLIAQSPVAPEQGHNLFREESLPEGTQAVCVLTEGGYVAEVAIPLSYIKALQGDNWQQIRLNAGVTDFDQDGKYQTTLTWKPEWDGKENIVGSGILYKTQPGQVESGK